MEIDEDFSKIKIILIIIRDTNKFLKVLDKINFINVRNREFFIKL